MNLVALLIAPAVVTMSLEGKGGMSTAIALGAVAVVVVAIVVSKRRPIAVGEPS
jgi:K(+)-stimulated pyrophosphate-energized sodium pump